MYMQIGEGLGHQDRLASDRHDLCSSLIGATGLGSASTIGGATITGTNVVTVPFRYICNIELLHSTGAQMIGSGTLIGPQAVLTAAHVVANAVSGRRLKPDRIRVTPGRAGSERRFGSSLAKNIIVPAGFFSGPGGQAAFDFGFDFAIVVLQHSFATSTGFWGQKPIPTGDSRGSSIGVIPSWRPGQYKVNHSGYPPSSGGFQVHRFTNTDPTLSGDFLLINSVIEKSESGSPVWVTRDRSLGGRHLWGIIISSSETFVGLPANHAIARLIRRDISNPDKDLVRFIETHQSAT
jgi:V8-like Glu-specific endopeptidase